MKRQIPLDALRGLALLAMAFSSFIPWKGLPPWMYHAQEPPPEHLSTPTLYGISWVDLVFPVFLFSMGAAIPLSQSASAWWRPFVRFVSLAAFAIAVQSLKPTVIHSAPTLDDWRFGLLAFGAMALAWLRLPPKAPNGLTWTLRAMGIGFVAYELATLQYPKGGGFRIYRNDVILLVLADMALFGGLAHVFVERSLKRNPMVRRESAGWLLVVPWALVLALFAGHSVSPLLSSLYSATPYPDLIRGELWKYLIVLLPGLAVGYMLKEPRSNGLLAICALAPACAACLYVGGMPWQWQLVLPLVALALHGIVRDQPNEAGIAWTGFALVAYGLFATFAFEGMRKDPGTSAYLIATPGLAILLLLAFMLAPKGFWPLLGLAKVGENPMLGYIAITHLVPAALKLSGIQAQFEAGQPDLTAQVWFAVGQTAAVGLVCGVASYCKISLRT